MFIVAQALSVTWALVVHLIAKHEKVLQPNIINVMLFYTVHPWMMPINRTALGIIKYNFFHCYFIVPTS